MSFDAREQIFSNKSDLLSSGWHNGVQAKAGAHWFTLNVSMGDKGPNITHPNIIHI